MNLTEPLSPVADHRPSDDDQLETLLVHLLGKLDHQLHPLERTDQVKRMIRSVEVSLGMLVTIIDTGIESYDFRFFSRELPEVWRLRERCKVVLDILDRDSWTGIFGLHAKANSKAQSTYHSLGQDFVQIFRDLIARFGEEFQSQQRRDTFHESSEAFLEDFAQRW